MKYVEYLAMKAIHALADEGHLYITPTGILGAHDSETKRLAGFFEEFHKRTPPHPVTSLLNEIGACGHISGVLFIPTEPIQLDTSRCDSSCRACIQRDKHNLSCYDNNASCCEANGKRAPYHSCGCL